MINNLKIKNRYNVNMDEFFVDPEFYYIVNDNQEVCAEPHPFSAFLILMSIIPFSFLLAMILVSQQLRLSGDLVCEKDKTPEDEAREKALKFIKLYPLDKSNNSNKEPNTKCISVIENTPLGNVFMKYDSENESFDYWSDYKEISFKYLETVARKYVHMFRCADLYIGDEEVVSSSEEETSSEEEDNSEDSSDDETYSNEDFEEDSSQEADEEDNEEMEEESDSVEEKEEESQSNEEEEEDSDSEIFAKLKTNIKMKETIEEEKKVNKFRYKGKLIDIIEFKQKKEQESPKKVSYSSWRWGGSN